MALELNTEIVVAERDLDGNKHFNGARQIVRYDEARARLLNLNGLDPDSLEGVGLIFVVSEQAYKHKTQAFPGDNITIHTKWKKEGRLSFPFYQEMRRGEDLISFGNGKYCFADINGGKLVREIPTDLIISFSDSFT